MTRSKKTFGGLKLFGAFHPWVRLAGKTTLGSVMLALLLVCPPAEALAQVAGRQSMKGHVPPQATTATRIGDMASTDHLDLAISLPLRNSEAMQYLLKDRYDKKSPRYRQFLSPEKFTQMFGPTEEDYQAVIAYAKNHKLAVIQNYGNRAVLDVSGNVADIEKAFHVKMGNYKRSDGTQFRSPDREPSVDLDVQLLHVTGLENYNVPKTNIVHGPHGVPGPQAKLTKGVANIGSGPTYDGVATYLGNNFRNAYAQGCTLDGSGQAIGLFELDGFYLNDILSYAATCVASGAGLNGINSSTIGSIVQSVYVNSNSNFDVAPGYGNDEVALDIDMVLCMAPGAQVIVFEGAYGDDVLADMANPSPGTPFCQQLSSSWTDFISYTDPSMTASLAEMALQGQSFFQASGDSGAYPVDPGDIRDENNMTVVGATELSTNAVGSNPYYSSETVWMRQYAIGTSGGGILKGYSVPVTLPGITIPTYQSPFITTACKGSTSYRNLPDVSMVGDAIFNISFDGAAIGLIGGTSAATPLWASVMAMTNQQALLNAQPPVGFANPLLYGIAGTATNYDPASNFHDITTGNNGYPAVTGYDLATGLGSPNASGYTLINNILGLLNETPTPTPTPTPSCCADGTSWDQLKSNFPPIESFQSLVYQNKMWAIGGVPGNSIIGNAIPQVWSSANGMQWYRTTSSAPYTECGGAAVTFDPGDGKGSRMWEIGGESNDNTVGTVNKYVNYSFDGIHWSQVTPVPSSGTSIFTAVTGFGLVVYNNQMWLIGVDSTQNDVWNSSNGVTWTQVNQVTPFPARSGESCLVYNSEMWVIAGYNSGPLTDVYSSSDGANWSVATSAAAFAARQGSQAFVYCGQMWLTGGYSGGGCGFHGDVWTSTNGSTWTEANANAFPVRSYFGALSFNGNPYVFGGNGTNCSGISGPYGDTWIAPCSDAATPTPTSLPTPCYAPKATITPTGFSFTKPIAEAIVGATMFVLDSTRVDYMILSTGSGASTWYFNPAWAFSNPSGIATDTNGDIFVTDTGHNRVDILYFFEGAGQWVSVGSANSINFSSPRGIATDSNYDFYVADTGNNRVVEMNLNPNSGGISYVNTFSGTYVDPVQVAVDREGNYLFVTDYPTTVLNSYPRVSSYILGPHFGDPWLGMWYPNGTSATGVTATGLAVGLDNNVYQSEVIASSPVTSQIIVDNNTGSALMTIGGASGTGSGKSQDSMGIAFDICGNLYQGDSGASSHNVRVYGQCGVTCQLNPPVPTYTHTNTPTFTRTSTFTRTPTRTSTPTKTPTPHGAVMSDAMRMSEEGITPTPTPSPSLTVVPVPDTSGAGLDVTAVPNISRNGVPVKLQVELGKSVQLRLAIYTVMGELVYQASVAGNPGLNTLEWPLENQMGSLVASGLYIYTLQANDGTGFKTRTGKIIVIH